MNASPNNKARANTSSENQSLEAEQQKDNELNHKTTASQTTSAATDPAKGKASAPFNPFTTSATSG